MITALCGGVGGSKLTLGLYRTLPAGTLSVIVNTADDLEFCGLHVSPDLDTVCYTLAGIANTRLGWGIEGDTFGALGLLQRYGAPAWFQVGDQDLATDVYRTWGLRSGSTLTEVTSGMTTGLGVQAAVLPMTDNTVATRLLVDGEWIDFQAYFVRLRHQARVEAIRYDGANTAQPSAPVLAALREADVIVVVNSNPVLSILPILALPGVRAALETTLAARVAVTPIVGGDAVTGPAGELMRLIGQPPTALGVARAYTGLIDGIVIDERDAELVPSIESEGLAVLPIDTLMPDLPARERVAAATVTFARQLR